MNSDHKRKDLGAIVGGMLTFSASPTFAAGPELPPAEYKTPPVGTIQPFGKMAKAPPLKLLDSMIFSGNWGGSAGPSSRIVSEQGLRVSVEAEQTPQYSDVRRASHDGGDFMFVRK